MKLEIKDKSIEVAKKYTDKIFIRKNELNLNVNKNFGFSKANSDWIMYVDPDEEIPKEPIYDEYEDDYEDIYEEISYQDRSPNDQRSDVMNPNNEEYKMDNDNRSNQMNPNNKAHSKGRSK